MFHDVGDLTQWYYDSMKIIYYGARLAPSVCIGIHYGFKQLKITLETCRSSLYHQDCGVRGIDSKITNFCQGWLFLQNSYRTHKLHKKQKDLVKV